MRELIAEQLAERFGLVSDDALNRISELSVDELHQLGRSLLRANSLQELGLPESQGH